MERENVADDRIDSHLLEIKHGSDAARAIQIICYGIAAFLIVLGVADRIFAWNPRQDWWSFVGYGVNCYFIGFAFGYVRKVTLTIVKIVEELRTTV